MWSKGMGERAVPPRNLTTVTEASSFNGRDKNLVELRRKDMEYRE